MGGESCGIDRVHLTLNANERFIWASTKSDSFLSDSVEDIVDGFLVIDLER